MEINKSQKWPIILVLSNTEKYFDNNNYSPRPHTHTLTQINSQILASVCLLLHEHWKISCTILNYEKATSFSNENMMDAY